MGFTLKTLVPFLVPALSYAQITISPTGTAILDEIPNFDGLITGSSAMEAFSTYDASLTAAPEFQAISSDLPPALSRLVGGLPGVYAEDNRDTLSLLWEDLGSDAREFLRSVYAEELQLYIDGGFLTSVVIADAAAAEETQTASTSGGGPADNSAEPSAEAEADPSETESDNAALPMATGAKLGMVLAAGIAAGVGMVV